jgi:hypothetical protein
MTGSGFKTMAASASIEAMQMFPPHFWTLRVARVDWSVEQLHSLQILALFDNVIPGESFLHFLSFLSVGCNRS